jgi:hypothetical protein
MIRKLIRVFPIAALVFAACTESPTSESAKEPQLAAGGTGNPHFQGQVSFQDLGTTLQISGTIAGLGTANVDITITAQGTASVTCTNPGGNVAPGQSKTVTVSGAQANVTPVNGKVQFTVTTTAPSAPSGACPNSSWTASVVDVAFTSATITVTQSGTGTVLLTQTYQL